MVRNCWLRPPVIQVNTTNLVYHHKPCTTEPENWIRGNRWIGSPQEGGGLGVNIQTKSVAPYMIGVIGVGWGSVVVVEGCPDGGDWNIVWK